MSTEIPADILNPANAQAIGKVFGLELKVPQPGIAKAIDVASVLRTDEFVNSASQSEDLLGRNTLQDVIVLDTQRTMLDQIDKASQFATVGDLISAMNSTKQEIAGILMSQKMTTLLSETDPIKGTSILNRVAKLRTLQDLYSNFNPMQSNRSEVITRMRTDYKGYRDGLLSAKIKRLMNSYIDMTSGFIMSDEEVPAADYEHTLIELGPLIALTHVDNYGAFLDTARGSQNIHDALIAAANGYAARAAGLKTSEPADVELFKNKIEPAIKAIYLWGVRNGYIEARELVNLTGSARSDLATTMSEQMSGGVRTKLVRPIEAPKPLAKEIKASTENIIYNKNIRFIGDQHGNIQFPEEGSHAVYVGDIIDVKDLPRDMNRFPGDLARWLDGVESGKFTFVLGNHDVTIPYILRSYDYIRDPGLQSNPALKNIRDNALAAVNHWFENCGGHRICDALGISVSPAGQRATEADIAAISTNPLLKRFANVCVSRGRLYSIANERLVAHTLPLADKNTGKLLEIEDGLTGLDGLDSLQQRLRDPAHQLHILERLYLTEWTVHRQGKTTSLKYENGGPLWNRSDQIDAFLPKGMIDKDNETRVSMFIAELNKQAQVRGTNIHGIIFGHTQDGGIVFPELKIVNIDHSAGQAGNMDTLPSTRSDAGGSNERLSLYTRNAKAVETSSSVLTRSI